MTFFRLFSDVASGIQVLGRNFTFSRAKADALAQKLERRRASSPAALLAASRPPSKPAVQPARQQAGGKVVAGSRQAAGRRQGRRRQPAGPQQGLSQQGRRSQARSSPPAKQANSPGGKVVAGSRSSQPGSQQPARQASQQSRRQGCCRLSWQGHQASSPARSSQAAGRLTARVVAWEADVSGFLRNEQSIFPYQISFPDEPQMQFLSCPWGGPLQMKVAHTSFPSDS